VSAVPSPYGAAATNLAALGEAQVQALLFEFQTAAFVLSNPDGVLDSQETSSLNQAMADSHLWVAKAGTELRQAQSVGSLLRCSP